MANTYNFLKTVSQKINTDFQENPPLFFLILLLFTIPLSYAFSSIALALLVVASVYYFKKKTFRFDINLLLPIVLYLLMGISFFWSIAPEKTLQALPKEISLLLVPLCFLGLNKYSTFDKDRIIHYYSHSIVLFSVFYLLKAIVRFAISKDTQVFFYHELVTKDVNAIHVSIYVAIAFFYFFTKSKKTVFDIISSVLLFAMVFLLTSKNIIGVFIGLMVLYHLFYSNLSKKMRMKNLIVFCVFLVSLSFVDKIKDRFREEYETIMVDSSVNDVISKGENKVYNVSIKQAWTNSRFEQNDYFPGTAFRVYQFRIFTEMLHEDNIFWTGYGLDASYPKIEQKGLHYNIYLGNEQEGGYQTKNFHNQYIQNFAELGIFGLLLLLGMLFLNMKKALKNKDFIHISFAVLMISLFLTESFLWRQRGVLFFTILYCVFNAKISMLNNDSKESI